MCGNKKLMLMCLKSSQTISNSEIIIKDIDVQEKPSKYQDSVDR